MSVGIQYITPGNGYKRIDDRDPNIEYIGIWGTTSVVSSSCKSTLHYSGNSNNLAAVVFYIYSSKIRVISAYNDYTSSDSQIKIDDTSETFSTKGNLLYNACVYEKEGLDKKIHYVKITTNSQNFVLDAIDIDEDGQICTQIEYELQEGTASSSIRIDDINASYSSVYSSKKVEDLIRDIETSGLDFDIWTRNKDYSKDRYVVYDHKLYQAKEDVLGALSFDPNKYELIIGYIPDKVPNWLSSGHNYKVDDRARQGNYVYKCIVNHISSSNFTNDANNWIVELDKYYRLTQAQYDLLVANGTINNANKYLYIVEDEKKDYEKEVLNPSLTWMIQHNLQTPYYKLNIHIIDGDGNPTYCDIDKDNTTDNLLVLKFSEPTSGIIYIKK